MTTLEWILIGIIALLLAVLIPILVFFHKMSKGFSELISKIQF